MNAVDPWKHQNSIIEACNASYGRSDQQTHGTCRQAADHSNSAMEAQASGSYPAAAAADHSDGAMEAQASGSYPVAADHSNSAMEVQASDSLSSSRQQCYQISSSSRS